MADCIYRRRGRVCTLLCLFFLLHNLALHAQVCPSLDWSTPEPFTIYPASAQFPPPAGIAYDRFGAMYVSGTVMSAADFDLRTSKYSCSGALVWSHTYNRGTAESPSFVYAGRLQGNGS